jgi:hypothetical protein
MTDKIDYTFLVGAPGSRWSGVGQLITENYDYNTEDETPWRLYKHGDFTGHKGAYFGPGMELGSDFHRLEKHYKNDVDGFLKHCDKAWDGQGVGTKMIKCHQFSYNLWWLYRNIPNANILLVRRGDQACFDWWKQAGGWDITYPNYQWYINDEHMQHYIEIENKMANMFVQRHTGWENFTERWLTYTIGEHNIKLDMEKYDDVEVALIKSNKYNYE